MHISVMPDNFWKIQAQAMHAFLTRVGREAAKALGKRMNILLFIC